MPKSLLIALKDIRQRLKDRAGLAFMLITPLILTLLLGLTFGGAGGDDEDNAANFRVPVAVVNYDAGQEIGADGDLTSLFAPDAVGQTGGLLDFDLSALGLDEETMSEFLDSSADESAEGESQGLAFGQVLAEILASDDMGVILDAELVEDEAAARALVERGEQYCCVVVIPENFTASLLSVPTFGPDTASLNAAASPAASADVTIYSDPGSEIGAQIVESIVRQTVSSLAINSLGFNVTLDELFAQEEPPSLTQLSTVLQSLFDGLGEQIETAQSLNAADNETGIGPATSLATVNMLDATGERASFDVLAYFAPSMAILFVALGTLQGARTILREERDGTLDRLNATPTRPAALLAGKLLGTFFGGALQFGALLLASTLIFQISWGQPLGVALVATLVTLVFTSLGLLIAVIAQSESAATTISTFVVMVFAAVGGNFLPAANFPDWMQSMAQGTPNYWSLNGFLKLAQGESVAALGPEIAVLAGMTALFFVAGLWLYQRRFA